jgi:hypothetical protein
MQERFYAAVGPVALVAAGTTDGKLTLESTSGFKVKMRVFLTDSLNPHINLQVKRVNGPTELEVGPIGGSINDRTDVSVYGVTAFLEARRQSRPSIPENERQRFIYEEEPVVADRVLFVDEFGSKFTSDNPIPFDSKVINETTILALMEPFLNGLTYDEIRQEFFNNYTMYDLYNNGSLIGTSLKVFYEDGRWRVQATDTEFLLGTEIDNELLVQENSDAIALES